MTFKKQTKNRESLPPLACDLELERAILGVLFTDKKAFFKMSGQLKATHFFDPTHQEIYREMQRLFGRGQSINEITVLDGLRKSVDLGPFSDTKRLIYALAQKFCASSELESLANILMGLSLRREMALLGKEITSISRDLSSGEPLDVLNRACSRFYEVVANKVNGSKKVLTDYIQDEIDLVEKNSLKKGLIGLETGFSLIDKNLNGLHPKELVVLGARPGMGKTTLALRMMSNLCKRGIPCAFFSLEMGAQKIINWLIAADSQIPSQKLRSGKLEEGEWSKFYSTSGALGELPMHLDDTAGLTLDQFRMKCRVLKHKHNIEVVFVDYLQLMALGHRSNSRVEEVSKITEGLKTVAMELSISIVANSQLSRAVEVRGGVKEPQLSDLRESGAIEQAANVVMFLYRPEYYAIVQTPDILDTKGVAKLTLAKARDGSIGSSLLKFRGEISHFEDLKPQ